MADQILSLLVGKLVDYFAVPVGRQFSYLFCYNGNLEEFRSQLRGLEMTGNDVKLRVEAAERKGEVILPSVEDLLKRVGAVSDESKGFVEEEDAISKCCFNGPLNLKVRYQRSRKAKKKAVEFEVLNRELKFDSVSVPAPPLPIGSVNNENEFDFESRRSIFNEIMEAMKDDGVGMIGIWGMPGIGKTTLVKRIAKYARDEGLFEEVAMAVVSQNPSFKSIQGQIADRIGLTLTRESEGGRADQLLQTLLARKKPILIILDDIWDRIELNDIGIPSGSQHKGCKVILTSRIRGVCEEMGTEEKFTVDLLSENEALDLFLKMSGVDDRCSEKGRLAEKLCEECGRLPISIAIVARGLLNNRKVSWEDMLNRLRKSDPDRKVRASIELSYDNLYREEEKMFFLLCCVFPEDYEIPVQVLFEYGLGLNLFERVDNVDEATVRAYNLALSLKSQCLLLDEGDENFVKMHDVIRDVALAIASEGKHVFLVPGKTATSLWFDDDVKKLPDVSECPQLQILILNIWYRDLQFHDNFFARMKNLIVLDMLDMRFVRLPQSFAALENLRILRLSYSELDDISAIGKLQNLISLSFYGSNIKVLPKEVRELSNLRLLDLSHCKRLEVITPGVIQNLSQLEGLRVHDNFRWYDGKEICRPENTSLSELIHLSRLMILEICIPDASMLPDDVLFKNLTKFKVSIGFVVERQNICRRVLRKQVALPHHPICPIFSNSQILKLRSLSENEFLQAGIKMLMKKAQYMELKGISGISVVLHSHFGGYRLLKELIVNHCEDVNYVLDMDMTKSEYELEIPSLQLLHLIDLPLLKEISKGEFPTLFVSKLEHLLLCDLPHLVHLWPFQAESNLTMMSVESCDKLEYLFDLVSAKSLSKLEELKVGECRNLQAICLNEKRDDDIVFPQLSHLKLWELENLTSFASKFTSESTLFSKQVIFCALETIHIDNLEKLEKIWHIHTPIESFFQLNVLKLTQCPGLLDVFPPQVAWGLRNLEEICIENCHKLETLFQLDDVPLTVGDEMVILPRLLTLKLVNLPKFRAILRTTSQNISQATVSFGRLKNLVLERLESMEEIWHRGHLVTTAGELNILKVKHCDRLLKVFPSNLLTGLQNLVRLHVRSCRSLEHVFEVEDHPPLLSNLQKLKLCDLPQLKQLWWNKNTRECFGLPCLRDLTINTCPTLQFIFDSSVANRLETLESLLVKSCSSIVEIVAEKPGKKIEFPVLHTLSLANLPCFKVNQSVEFPQAESVLMYNCFNMEKRRYVSVRRDLAGPVRFFESFVE